MRPSSAGRGTGRGAIGTSSAVRGAASGGGPAGSSFDAGDAGSAITSGRVASRNADSSGALRQDLSASDSKEGVGASIHAWSARGAGGTAVCGAAPGRSRWTDVTERLACESTPGMANPSGTTTSAANPGRLLRLLRRTKRTPTAFPGNRLWLIGALGRDIDHAVLKGARLLPTPPAGDAGRQRLGWLPVEGKYG
jgi:hypothetical protein